MVIILHRFVQASVVVFAFKEIHTFFIYCNSSVKEVILSYLSLTGGFYIKHKGSTGSYRECLFEALGIGLTVM